MAVLLGYTTALEYWRSCASITDATHHELLLGTSTERKNTTNSLQTKMRKKAAQKHCSIYASEHPSSHLIILKQQSIPARCHVHAQLPPYSCIRYSNKDDVFVSTPEFCFLQMASLLTVEQLIALGFELCGSYARTKEATVYQAFPLTSVEKLDSFLSKANGFNGIKRARRALRYILPRSASPMETALTMLLCLPYSLGGFGIASPKLNYPIDIPIPLKKKIHAHYYICDLFWPDSNLAIEYDSDLAHSGIYKTTKDAARRSVLTTLDISVLSVTRPQIMGRASFIQLAHLVARKTGKRIRCDWSSFSYQHQKLRTMLLSSNESSIRF